VHFFYFIFFKLSIEQPNFLVFTWCDQFHLSFATPVATFENKLPTSVKVTGTYEGCRVFERSAHLKSRPLLTQSPSVGCCTLSLSLCAPAAGTSDRHWRIWPSCGRFFTSAVSIAIHSVLTVFWFKLCMQFLSPHACYISLVLLENDANNIWRRTQIIVPSFW
jgi:hypothetical protein